MQKFAPAFKIGLSALFAGFFIFPKPALAWTKAGHEIVAIIAQNRLSSKTLSDIREIIGADVELKQISKCADAMRDGEVYCADVFHIRHMPSSLGWHIMNIPVNDSPVAASLGDYCSFNGEEGNCAIHHIGKNLEILSSLSAARGQRQEALAVLVHLVGDVHQPLHCAMELVGDAGHNHGGVDNQVFLQPENSRTNLHMFWDDMVKSAGETDSLDTRESARQLESDMQSRDLEFWTKEDFISAGVLESFEIAKNTVYPAYHKINGENIGPEYRKEMKQIVDERLQKAGVRLAYLLEQAFSR